jgi:quercetin dioxygenase-like cupin family protein
MFIHAGAGEIFGNGKWNTVKPGTVIFMPPNDEHQIRNIRKELLILACLVPSIAPEL